MFKVECPGCKAPYQVDERRIPPNGLKMRCPKCGTSFKVDPPSDPQRTGPSPVLGAVLGMGADSIPPPAPAPPRANALKKTMTGVAPEVTLPRPQAPQRPGAQPPAARAGDALDARSKSRAAEPDLPAPVTRAAPRAPAPPRAAPGRPAAPASPASRSERETLPAPPRPAQISQPELDAGIDLPSPRQGPVADLPATGGGLADVPSPVPEKQRASSSVDLPSVADAAPSSPPARPGAPSFGEIELDLPVLGTPSRPAARSRPDTVDLPSPARAAAPRPFDDGGIDLPDITEPPLPELAGKLPELTGNLPEFGMVPPAAEVDLPDISAELPTRASASLPEVARAPLPSTATAGFPIAAGDRSPGSLPPLEPPWGPGSDAPRGVQDSFGELELPLVTPSGKPLPMPPMAAPLEADPFGEVTLPPPRSFGSPAGSPPGDGAGTEIEPSGKPVVRQQGGGTSYGEVDLAPGADANVPLAAPPASLRGEEDMEFGGVPQEAPPRPAVTSVQSPPESRVATPTAAETSAPRKHRALKILAGVGVLLVGGASLALVPALGPFGAYWITDQVRAGEYEQLLAETIRRGRRHLQNDSYSDSKRMLVEADAARSRAKRVPALAAYTAFLGFARELRFGPDAETHARAKVLLEGLEGDAKGPYVDLAHAARAGVDGKLARARQLLQTALRRSPRDPDALGLKGEIELRAKDARAALDAWTSLSRVEDSARAAFGLARARFAAGDLVGAERDADLALRKNPQHLGARVLVARIAAKSREREAQAVEWLEAVAKRAQEASPGELVMAHTLLGDIHLARSRISRAEAAYTEALRIDPKAARALIGLGEALYRAGRYSEAQARFEAGSQADPDDVTAKIGVAKSKLMLERVEDAHNSLKKLRESHPKSLGAAYWYGRALEALGNREQAENAYREALTKDPSDSALVDTYIALALLQNQQGRAEEATKTLQAARERLPNSPEIHKALGDVALTRGQYAEAQAELRRAIELDAEDLGAKFKLGVALRRDGKFEEALRAFEEVSAVDREYPGLALEHGLLYEASGETEKALQAYEGALQKAPDDPDLLLRVGCGYASAGRSKEAQPLLRKVLAVRPMSAETNHCLGRALLAEGSRLADALRMLDRAVELDPHRAEYHLYVGWAANEAGNVPKAQKALNTAIELDQGLADAYWQRGVLRSRQGSVREAIADLTRALALRPSRYEAHAALADAYYDLGKEALALAEWRKAVTANPDNATWRFRFGKLLAANQMNDAARVELAAALELAEKTPEPERWVWEAHHFMARALGNRPEAAEHWAAFLRQGPLDSPYRAEAKAALQRLGKPWSGN